MRHFLFIAVFLMFSSLIYSQDNDCKSVCNVYLGCAEKQFNRKLNSEDSKKATLSCLKSCNANKEKILACYKKSSNQCLKLHNCLIKSYKS